jgi:hypothetical protein
MTNHIRSKAAAFAVLAGALVAPGAASAATHHASAKTAHVRALQRELKALESARANGAKLAPRDYFSDIISEIEYDLSTADVEAILGDLPGVGDYG